MIARSFSPLLLVAAGAALLLHIFSYQFVVDDTFISLRYAKRLVETGTLTWNDGEYVEGFSNMLWVLLAAGFGRIGVDLLDAVQAMGLICTLLTPLAFFYVARSAKLPPLALALALLLFIISPPIAMWARVGLETPLVMLLFAFAVALCQPLLTQSNYRHALTIGILMGLVCWLRPETPVYVGIISFSFLLWARTSLPERLGHIALWSGVAALCFGAQLTFRYFYYGEWVPNTVMAKVAFSPERLVHGFQYISKAFAVFLPLLLYIFLNLSALKNHAQHAHHYRFGAFCLSVVLLSFAAICVAGGDVFLGFRPIVPLIPIMLFAVMTATAPPAKLPEKAFICLIVGYYAFSHISADVNNVRTSSVSTTGREIGEALKERYADTQPLIAVYTAGAIPYYSDLPSLDVYGLTNKELTQRRKQAAHFGKGMPGHDLFDVSYVESKKPDILVFEAIPGLPALCDAEAYKKECESILLPHYREETLTLSNASVRLWLRRDSKKIP